MIVVAAEEHNGSGPRQVRSLVARLLRLCAVR